MAKEISSFQFKVAARDEYELEHYGFTVDQFKMENAAFIKQTISKTVDDAVQNFLKKLELKDSETSIKEKILLSSKSVSDQIISSTHDKIDNINAIIEDKFRIPDNVLMETDRKHYQYYTKFEEQELEMEVAEIEKQIIVNASFMASLNNEIIANEDFEETLKMHEKVLAEAEKLLAINLDTELLKSTSEKLKN
ncbi:unnamed protein product [Diamesa serratosioi]